MISHVLLQQFRRLGIVAALALCGASPAFAADDEEESTDEPANDPAPADANGSPERIVPNGAGGRLPFRPGGASGKQGEGMNGPGMNGPGMGGPGMGGPGGQGGPGMGGPGMGGPGMGGPGMGGPGMGGPGMGGPGQGGMEGGEGGLGPKQGANFDARGGGEGGVGGAPAPSTQKAPCMPSKGKVTMDYVDAPVSDVVKYMAEITCRNFIIKDDLSGKITIISHQQVGVDEAYEAFLSALEINGYTTVQVGKNTQVVPTTEAANHPLKVLQPDDPIPATDNYVTQIVQVENVSVSDMASVVKELAGTKVRVVAYAPTNTLIITDSAFNIRRVVRIVSQLDVAAPKAKLEVVPLRYATAANVAAILQDVYSVEASSSSSSSSKTSSNDRNSRSRRSKKEPEATGGSATSVGSEGAYISKIISDERTNSLILMANDEAMAAVKTLIARLDMDIDPASRSQIHVVYLENAKAADVAAVLQDLSSSSSSASASRSSSSSSSRSRQSGSNNSSRSRSSSSSPSRSSNSGGYGGGGGSRGGGFGGGMPGGAPGDMPGGPPGGFGGPPGGVDGSTGVVAAFDSGMRITADENTNALVIIAAPEDYRVIQSVIAKLDIRRRQVFVEAVVLEVGSEDEFDFGIGYHGGLPDSDGNMQLASAQLNGSSFGATTDALSGLAMGIFGAESVDIPLFSSTGESTVLSIPTFGIALNALASNSGVDILSNPSLLIVDNEEATISVGRNVPFPVSSGRDNNNNPIVSYQREDVGIELKVTPQINESNTVTMELSLKVAEVEEDSSGLDVSTAGFITSEREMENVAVVDDNQTIVIGGLIGKTATNVETKIPVLGDIPLIGALFRGTRNTERKTNLLIFLTPHVINESDDLQEVYRVKWAQRQEFVKRFYGKSRDAQQKELAAILAGSMTAIDQPSQYRPKERPVQAEETIGAKVAPSTILPPPAETPPVPAAAPAAPAEPAPAPAPAGGE
jgi:general secretion pathway protein D